MTAVISMSAVMGILDANCDSDSDSDSDIDDAAASGGNDLCVGEQHCKSHHRWHVLVSRSKLF